ncbi:MAG TPA: ATP-grasp domain-containing protein [Phycisphaerales bacterium]|nr:ATP-grasp domain-containing protein [Phycisphaerales bacterium]
MTESRRKDAGQRHACPSPKAARSAFNVLFTCIGRRVSLLETFRRAAAKLGLNAAMLGTETTPLSSALQLCDRRFIVEKVNHPEYLRQLLDIVKSNDVRLVVPTVDLDLQLLADNKRLFEQLGCRLLVSDPEVVRICQDKRKTYDYLTANGFKTPRTLSIAAALKARDLTWPCFIKPWDGYASRGNAVAHNRSELRFYGRHIPNAICQEYVEGAEHTCDVYVDFDMRVRCVVPRKRLEVRAGEVSKSRIVKDRHIMERSALLVETLGAGPGVITLQLFVRPDGSLRFIEVNPRFGGGAPLSIKAGADFPQWIWQELVGRKPRIRFDGFRNHLTMLRYDCEVWLDGSTGKGVTP